MKKRSQYAETKHLTKKEVKQVIRDNKNGSEYEINMALLIADSEKAC